jgi:hypothetical protein
MGKTRTAKKLGDGEKEKSPPLKIGAGERGEKTVFCPEKFLANTKNQPHS